MCLDHKHQYVGSVRSVLSVVVMPLQYAVAWPRNAVSSLSEQWSSRQTLIETNQKLRRQELGLQVKLQRFLALEKENEQLRDFLKAAPQSTAQKTLLSQIMAIDSDLFTQEVLLDKGSKDGVYVGQPVLDSTGIMGQIIQVNPMTSRMLLITDTRSAVPVRNLRSGVRGIVVGKGQQGQLALINMPVTADIKAGDILVSSGLGGRYPAGHPVGIVGSVKQTSEEQFAVITVTPSAQLARSQHVMLLWPQMGEGHAN